MINRKNSFWKLFSLSSLVVLVKTIMAFAVNKFLAFTLGPSIFASVAQFQNLLSVGQGFSSLSLQNGWVSLTSRYKNTDELPGIWRGGVRLTIFGNCFLILLGIVFLFVAPLETLFPEIPKRFVQVAILFALPGIFASNITTICLSVLNGLEKYKRFAFLSVATSFLQGLWVILFLYFHVFSLLSVIATQSLLSAFIATALVKKFGLSLKALKEPRAFNKENRVIWFSFILMGFIPMILTPLALIAIRQGISVTLSPESAGIWQGVMRISDFFTLAFSSVLGVILLPKFSVDSTREEFWKMFRPLLFKIFLFALFSTSLCFVFREFLVEFLLSKAFLKASDLLPYQLLGDFFKAFGFSFGLILIACKETKKFICSEIIFQIFLVGATFVLLPKMGLFAPVVSYAIENILYALTTFILVCKIQWKSL